MSRDWYVLQGEKERGPFTRGELQILARNHKLNPGARVRKGTSGPWTPASSISGLFPWIDAARTADIEAAPVGGPGPEQPARRRWILPVAIGASALVSATIAVAAWVLLAGGREVDVPAGAGPAVAEAESGDREDGRDRPVMGKGRSGRPAAPPEIDLEAMVASMLESIPDVPQSEVDVDPESDAVPEISPAAAPVTERPAVGVAPGALVEVVPVAPQIDPKPLLPPIPEVKTEISDAEIREFDGSVRMELRAVDAHARYEVFSQSFEFTEEQRDGVDAELATWKQRADAELYRLGADWVALEEVKEAEEEAERLFQQADALARVGSWEGCIERLEDANRSNPNGIKAPYNLGLLWSLPFTEMIGPANAERWFRTVLLRHPNHAGALNSIAIAQIKQREHAPALESFRRAAELTESCPEVTHNLGRFIALVESGRVSTQRSTLRRYTDLYAELIADEKGAEFNASTGWRHMLPVFPQRERDDVEPAQVQVAAGGDQLEPRWGGSGFVVAPGYVMTNRHVVEDDDLGICDVVRVADPANPVAELPGDGIVMAVSDATDLAIVHFPALQDVPDLSLHSEPVALATDVLILGYPRGDVFGVGLKATRGVVSGVPDNTRPLWAESYLFDAMADSGNSGGPVLDRHGRVIALLTTKTPLLLRVEKQLDAEFTGGVPSPAALAFASEHVPGFAPDEIPVVEPFEEWAAITDRASRSVFRLTCYYKSGAPALEVAAREAGYRSSIWEDPTCPTCDGRTWLPCSRRGCIRGEVTVRYYQYGSMSAGRSRIPVQVQQTRKAECPVCDGEGVLDCPHCVDGIDSFLR